MIVFIIVCLYMFQPKPKQTVFAESACKLAVYKLHKSHFMLYCVMFPYWTISFHIKLFNNNNVFDYQVSEED